MTLLYLKEDLLEVLAFEDPLVANRFLALITRDQLAALVLSQHLLVYLYSRIEVIGTA